MSPVLLLLLAFQQKPPEISVAGVAGWDRLAPLGARAPILVEIQNRGPDRDVRLALAWGPSSATRGDALGSLLGRDRPRTLLSVALPSGSRKRVWAVLEPVPYDGASAWVQVLDPRTGSNLATGELIPRVLPASKRLVAVVGRDRPAGLPFGDMEAAWLPPDRLPHDWRGYDPLDALVWLEAPVSDLASPAQLEALRLWIARGGRLVVARAETVGLAGTPMEDLLPVRLHSGREVELPALPEFPRGRIPVLHTTVRRGKVRLQSTDGTPLVVVAPQGAGTVVFAAFDPSRKPFSDFPRAAALWSALLEVPDARPDPSREDLNPDRSGLAALVPLAARIPDVAPPALEWLFLIIAVYVAVVGPLDFFLLRAFKRLEWTWFTFPVYVVAFTALILVAGGAFIVESAYHREVAIVDHYPDSDVTRRRAAAAVFATTPERYRVDDAFPFTSSFLTHEARGTPMPGPVGAIQVEDGRVRDWTLERGATGVVLADRLSLDPVPLAFTLAGAEGPRISLSVRNDSGSAHRNAFLVTPRATYRLDDLPRGDSTVTGTRVHDLPGSLPMDPEERGGRSEAAMNNGLRRELMKAPSDWTARGGSVLLAEPASAEPMVALSPAPGRRSAYVLTRVFQRAP